MLSKRMGLGAAVLFVAGCTSDQPTPTAFEVRAPLFVMGGNSASNLGTHLTGAEEVPATNTQAQGQAIFRVNGNTVDFRLIATNIDNVTQAHIHCGRPTGTGPIRMWLWPNIGTSGAQAPGGGGPQSGVLASGTFSLAGVTCLAADVGSNMSLLDAILAGLAYVNVHTNDGVAPTNTGPGDFPGGEIRGQLGDKNN